MLVEIKSGHNDRAEPVRKWCSDSEMDLIVWYGAAGVIVGFQLCYDKQGDEHALTWYFDKGFSHKRIDSGEQKGGMHHKMTPVLVPDGKFDGERLKSLFEERQEGLDAALCGFIKDKIGEVLPV